MLALAVSPCGKWIAAGGNARVAVFELATGKELALPGVARGRYPAVAFSPDGKQLAAAAGLAKSGVVPNTLVNVPDRNVTS